MKQQCPFPNFNPNSNIVHKRKSLSLFSYSSKQSNNICHTTTNYKDQSVFPLLEQKPKKISLNRITTKYMSRDYQSKWLKISEDNGALDKIKESLEVKNDNIRNYRCSQKSDASFMSNEMKEVFKKGLSESHYDQMQKPNKKKIIVKSMLLKNIELTKKKDQKKGREVKKDIFENEKVKYQKDLKKEIENTVENVNRDLKMKYMKKISIATDNLFSEKYKFNDDFINKKYYIDFKVSRMDIVRLTSTENNIQNSSENDILTKTFYNNNTNCNPQIKRLYIKIKRTIISCAFKYKRCNLSFKEIEESQYKFIIPFQLKNSRHFFNCVSEGNIEEVKEILYNNKFYVFCFNEAHQTPLHIAAKKNNDIMINILVDHGADVNSVDFIGRSPLHIAALHNNYKAVKTLIFAYSDPLLINDYKNTPKQFCMDKSETYNLLYFAEKLHKIHRDYYSFNIFGRIFNGLNYIIANYSIK